MFKRIDHAQITVPPDQVDKAKAFYIQYLGFEITHRPATLDHIPGFWLQAGGAQLHIGYEEGIERRKTNAHPAFEVTNLDFYRQKIVEGGGIIDPSIPIPGRDRIEFRDPFDNRIELLEYDSSPKKDDPT